MKLNDTSKYQRCAVHTAQESVLICRETKDVGAYKRTLWAIYWLLPDGLLHSRTHCYHTELKLQITGSVHTLLMNAHVNRCILSVSCRHLSVILQLIDDALEQYMFPEHVIVVKL